MIILASHRFTDVNNKNLKNNIGLCNLLKTVLSVYNIVEDLGLEQKFIHKNICDAFKELFKNEIIYEQNTDKFKLLYINEQNSIKSLNNSDNIILNGWRLYNKNFIDIPVFKSVNGDIFPDNIENSIDFKYNNIPTTIKDEYLQLLKKLEINDNINNVINRITSKYQEFLSVHIRTWKTFGSLEDNRSDLPRYNHYLKNRDYFIEYINKSNYKDVFISTDNKDEIQYIIKNINNKNIFFTERNENLSNLQNDFIDIIILSKGKEIIGSFISTFTEMAWWYSNCNKNIIII